VIAEESEEVVAPATDTPPPAEPEPPGAVG
jgi:hypothetical protein